ncbi:stemmadenine O-acetyltransferase [Ricinus communis]|uniref:stemmadenine O-acetyltransferase n=1 Tax=Ricinus communis TaxID=3988 RepID=UPI00201A48D0|nr:stemmadenine O-acetyltransferase [Ricinus communis]
MKVEIISREMIKPSSPTPIHLKDFKICLLDELAPPSYAPILLLYSSTDFVNENCFSAVADKLKKSLSQTLVHFYPFSGKLKENLNSIDCNDEGALFLEAKVNVALSKIVKNPETNMLCQLFPFDPYDAAVDGEIRVTTGVQVNVFECGGVGIGVCVSHKIADGATMASFISSWASSATATGSDDDHQAFSSPRLDSAMIFPPKGMDMMKHCNMVIRNEKIMTKRFEFDWKKLANLKANIDANGVSEKINPTRVEAVTALIWRSAMEVKRSISEQDTIPCSIATHLVNIRERMRPPLPGHSIGNLWRLAVAPYLEFKKDVKLQELVGLIRESIRRIDNDYVTELQGEDGFEKGIEPLRELRELALLGGEGVEVYTFSSLARFPFYEIDFGLGKPVKVCTITMPIRNCVTLIDTRFGDGIEAWVTLTENDMAKFECSQELLQFVSAAT